MSLYRDLAKSTKKTSWQAFSEWDCSGQQRTFSENSKFLDEWTNQGCECANYKYRNEEIIDTKRQASGKRNGDARHTAN